MYNNFLYLHNCIKSICVVHPGELSRCRPVTLTSHLIMTMESIVLSHLHILDLLQMAYRAGVGVDEAIVYLLFHLESPGNTVKVMFSFALLFTSPVLSTSSSNHCCGRRWRRLVWTKGGAGDDAVSFPLSSAPSPLFSYNSNFCLPAEVLR